MAITLWRTRKPFEGLKRWFDEDFFTNEFGQSWEPALDVVKKDDAYVVKADLPGVEKKDIHIELKNHVLTLRGERTDQHEENTENYQRIERTFGSFERRFAIPEGVTEKDIHAKYANGVLELRIPIPKEEKPQAIKVRVD